MRAVGAACPLLVAVWGLVLLAPQHAHAQSTEVVSESTEVLVLEADLPGEERAARLDANENLLDEADSHGAPAARAFSTRAMHVAEEDLDDDSSSQIPVIDAPVANGTTVGNAASLATHNVAIAVRETPTPVKSHATAGARRKILLGPIRVSPSSFEINDVPYEILQSARNNFRSLIGDAPGRIAAEERYVGSLLSPLAPRAPLFPGEGSGAISLAALPVDSRHVLDTDDDPATLDSDKVYTVVDGHIVEVAQIDAPLLPERAPVRPPEGFFISVEEDGEKRTVTSDGTQTVAATPASAAPASAAPASAESASETPSTAAPTLAALAQQQAALALSKPALATPAKAPSMSLADTASHRFEIPTDVLAKDSFLFDPTGGQSAAPGETVEQAQLVSVRGRVRVPQGVKPESIVLQIAGTQLQIHPSADGAFEFREMPLGARFEIVAWDMNNILSRRIVPVSADGAGDVRLTLERNAYVDDLSAAFGVRQALTQSGFCATLQARNKDLLVGARVTVKSSQEWQGPFYYNENRLPDPTLTEPSRDGRFCVFNVRAELVDINVQLLNGTRRAFTVHMRASTFETDLAFDMGATNYRPVMPLELVDAAEAFDSNSTQDELRYASVASRRWLAGEDGATWARVYGLRLRTDAAYGSVLFERKDDAGTQYFPLGQELQEVRFSRDEEGAAESFTLLSRGAIEGTNEEAAPSLEAAVGRKSPIVVPVMDADALEDMARGPKGFDANPRLGSAFVSLNLAALGVDYSDVRLSLRDTWTGQSIAPFHFVPLAAGVKQSRQVRGFFTDIPEGQYTLLVTDSKGALKWLDVVRSRAGSLQVVSVRE